MEPMTARQIASAVDGVWLNPGENAPAVTAVCTDSRRPEPGCLFLPWSYNFRAHNEDTFSLPLCLQKPKLLLERTSSTYP